MRIAFEFNIGKYNHNCNICPINTLIGVLKVQKKKKKGQADTIQVQSLLKCHDTARADLKRGIREAEAACKKKFEDYFADNNPKRM